jgi:polyribonucleotide nucleotidyltransferase
LFPTVFLPLGIIRYTYILSLLRCLSGIKKQHMSLLQPKSITFDIGGGRMVTIETGKMARQADGSVTVRQGNCILLATVVANKEPKDGQSFFPLSVDYQEKFASAGRVPGSFFKREARLNDYEILTSRLIDRALRPLFPEDYL